MADDRTHTTDDTDDYGGLKGRFYRSYIRRPRAARVVGAVLWGTDFRPLYRHLSGLGKLAPGTIVLDAACGAGLALEWLEPATTPRYVGVDISPAMLEETRRVARRRGFSAVELHLADIASLPMSDGGAGACLCYNALHCVPAPATALKEIVRCLAPGGVLLGSSLVRGGTRRADRILDLDPTMGPGGTAADLQDWLSETGVHEIEVHASGALAVFSAKR